MTSNHHALMTRSYVLQWRKQEKRSREAERISKITSQQIRIVVYARLHEAGIASNRSRSECCSRIRSGLVHTTRHTLGVGNARSR